MAVPAGDVHQVLGRGLAQGIEHGGIGLGGLESEGGRGAGLKGDFEVLIVGIFYSPHDVTVLGQEGVQLLQTGSGFNISKRHF